MGVNRLDPVQSLRAIHKDSFYKKNKKSERGNTVYKGLGLDSRSNPSNFVVF